MTVDVRGPVLEVRDLAVRLPGEGGPTDAVRGLSLQVAGGESVGLVGASGSGKSVTALAVLGLLPTGARVTGSVRLSGAELLGRTDAELCRVRGRRVALVPQDPLSALTPVLSVGGQLAEAVLAHAPGRPGRSGRLRARDRAVELLARVGLPDPLAQARAFPHELSGGMRQRAMIAMAMAHDPDLIIADEPTSALDVLVQAEVLDVLRTAQESSGAALLLITHDLAVVAQSCDRVVVLDAGQVVEEGRCEDVLAQPRQELTRRMLAAAPRERPRTAPPARPEAPVVLAVSDLVRHYPAGRRKPPVKAVDGVSFDLRRGETLALVGGSGSGKTTTVREILALAAPPAGRIEVLGTDVGTLDRRGRRELRRDVQAVFQDPGSSLDPRIPVGETVALPLRVHGAGRAAAQQRATELLRAVGLPADHLDRLPAALSGGQRQRVAVARALALGPRLLVLDEPVSALDTAVRAGLLALLAELRERLGLSYLVVAHDLPLIGSIADRVAVLHLGRIVEIGAASSVLHRPAHPYTAALVAAVPVADPRARRRREPTGLPAAGPATGCSFLPRCPLAAGLPAGDRARCAAERPALTVAGDDHAAACHHVA